MSVKIVGARIINRAITSPHYREKGVIIELRAHSLVLVEYPDKVSETALFSEYREELNLYMIDVIPVSKISRIVNGLKELNDSKLTTDTDIDKSICSVCGITVDEYNQSHEGIRYFNTQSVYGVNEQGALVLIRCCVCQDCK